MPRYGLGGHGSRTDGGVFNDGGMEVWLRIDDYKLESMKPCFDSFVLQVNLRLKKRSHSLANVLNTHSLTLLGNKSWMINRRT